MKHLRTFYHNEGRLMFAVICFLGLLLCYSYGTKSFSIKPKLPQTKTANQSAKIQPHDANIDNWICMATVDYKDTDHVSRLLQTAKIPTLICGSLSYGVRVPKEYWDQAILLLEADAKKQHYWIVLSPSDGKGGVSEIFLNDHPGSVQNKAIR